MKENIFINNSLKISITNVCNYDCSYCSNEGQTHENKEYIDLNFIKQLCENIQKEEIYTRRVNITGGEPLLHKQLIEIVKEFAKVSECIALNTNASLLNKEKILELKNAGVSALKIGIDSIVGEQTKPCMKNTKNYVDIVKENIVFAKEVVPDTSLDVVLSEFNIDKMESIIEFIVSNKLNNSIFIELVQDDFWNNGNIPNKGIDFEVLLELLKKQNENLNYSYNEKKGLYSIKMAEDVTVFYALDYCTLKLCGSLCTRINSKGEMVPCIKEGIGIKLDLNKEIGTQISEANKKSFCNIN